MKNTQGVHPEEKFEISISKETLSLLPIEKFTGEIVIVDTPEGAEEAVRELEKASLIGFDTETKPAFQKGHINKVALLQLATENKCYLIRLSKIGMHPAVKMLLENENNCKIGLSIKDDFHNLNKIDPIEPKGFIDLQTYVKNFGITDISLTKIHAIIFGKRISKSQQLSNWEAPVLTKKQQEYAALDALACVNIYRHLKSGEFNPQKSEYRHLKNEN